MTAVNRIYEMGRVEVFWRSRLIPFTAAEVAAALVMLPEDLASTLTNMVTNGLLVTATDPAGGPPTYARPIPPTSRVINHVAAFIAGYHASMNSVSGVSPGVTIGDCMDAMEALGEEHRRSFVGSALAYLLDSRQIVRVLMPGMNPFYAPRAKALEGSQIG